MLNWHNKWSVFSVFLFLPENEKIRFFVWLDQLPQNCWRLPLFLAVTEENPSNSIEKKNTSHDSTPFFSNFIIYYRCNKVERVQSPALSSNGTVCLWGWEGWWPAGKETQGGRECSLKKRHWPFQKSRPGEGLLDYSLTFGSFQVDW